MSVVDRPTRELARFAAEPVLFAAKPTRLALAKVAIPVPSPIHAKVRVHRNHAFEPIAACTTPFLAYANLAIDFDLGDYDDTLAFEGAGTSDVELIHVDLGRYDARANEDAIDEWLVARLRALRSRSSVPILVATFGDPGRLARLRVAVGDLPDTHLAELVPEAAGGPAGFVDERTAAVSGTRLRGELHVPIARELALRYLPACLVPPRKAFALDLDETLYRGVLGEDGVDGVELTPAHRALQESLVAARGRGTFLALVSKNDPADVDTLFARRTDFPLRLSDFSVVKVGWTAKAEAIRGIAASLRIGTDAIVFVDDNPGELVSVATSIPDVHLIRASTDAAITRRAIELHPGAFRFGSGVDGALRVRDLAANDAREALARSSADEDEYFAGLAMTVTCEVDARPRLARLAELCAKTNQFNLALARLSATELERRMLADDASVVALSLEDRLSDSGHVAVLVLGIRDGRVVVDELCVSCRALGRRVEDALILPPILRAASAARAVEVAFRVAHGERNAPARTWLRAILGGDTDPAPGYHAVPVARLRERAIPAGIRFSSPQGTP